MDEGTECAEAWGWESGLPPRWGPCEDGGGGWAGCPGSWQAAGFGGGRGGDWGLGRPLWPLVSPGLQLMFAEHMPCGGPGRAPLLPTAPSEGGAVIVAIFQMGKRALKS